MPLSMLLVSETETLRWSKGLGHPIAKACLRKRQGGGKPYQHSGPGAVSVAESASFNWSNKSWK